VCDGNGNDNDNDDDEGNEGCVGFGCGFDSALHSVECHVMHCIASQTNVLVHELSKSEFYME